MFPGDVLMDKSRHQTDHGLEEKQLIVLKGLGFSKNLLR